MIPYYYWQFIEHINNPIVIKVIDLRRITNFSYGFTIYWENNIK